MDMMLLTFVGLYFLVPAFIVAALAATVTSRCGITGLAWLRRRGRIEQLASK